jgi:enediyne polyketide synthase
MAVANGTGVACDMEVVQNPPGEWQDVLTPDRLALADLLMKEAGDRKEVAATRVWSVTECLLKQGLPPNAPLVLHNTMADGWVSFRSGSHTIATYVANLREEECPLVLAVLVGNE